MGGNLCGVSTGEALLVPPVGTDALLRLPVRALFSLQTISRMMTRKYSRTECPLTLRRPSIIRRKSASKRSIGPSIFLRDAGRLTRLDHISCTRRSIFLEQSDAPASLPDGVQKSTESSNSTRSANQSLDDRTFQRIERNPRVCERFAFAGQRRRA